MPLVLTILSVLLVWALLGVLLVGLLLIHKTLLGVRAHLRKIAMGVRAIEQETRPLGARADAVVEGIGATAGAAAAAARRMADVERDLTGAMRLLAPR